MMTLTEQLLLALSLAADCFSVAAACVIIAGRRTTASLLFRLALLFGLFQAAMPLLSWTAMQVVASRLMEYGHWIAFALLLFIGLRMVKEGLRKQGPEEQAAFNPLSTTTQLALAVATSIDALAVGVSMAVTGYDTFASMLLPTLIIGIVSALMTIVGWATGKRFGPMVTRHVRAEVIAGTILILLAIKALIA